MRVNRHAAVALLVAPVLALLAWLAVGRLAGEAPAPAQPGRSYPLLAQPNCRYASGACDLKNAGFALRMAVGEGVSPRLRISASHALDQVQVAVATPGGDPAPTALQRGADGSWVTRLAARPGAADRIRLVAQAAGSFYYGEAATAFTAPPED